MNYDVIVYLHLVRYDQNVYLDSGKPAWTPMRTYGEPEHTGQIPGPPTPDQNVYHARTDFREERSNFSEVGANSRNQEKTFFTILHVSACFHPSFHTFDLGLEFKYSFQIRHTEKYDVGRKNV